MYGKNDLGYFKKMSKKNKKSYKGTPKGLC